MPAKTNAQLAGEYIAYREGQGMEVFKEWRPSAGGGFRECLFIVQQGAAGNETTFPQLCARLRQWLTQQEIEKSDPQVQNIARVVGQLAELRGGVPQDVAVLQALGVQPKKKKK
jgi:hypothetical protein